MIYVKPLEHVRVSCHPPAVTAYTQIAPVSQPLHMVCAVSNPERYVARYKHYRAFEKHMADSGVHLITVELAYRDRHFEVTSPGNPNHVQLRSASELWHKESLLNIGISRFPANWQYAGYCDADFMMTRPDFAVETVHQLQHYKWVQMFGTYSNLGPDHAPNDHRPMYGFVKVWKEMLNSTDNLSDSYFAKLGLGAPGGAWAFRRDAYDAVGGFLDTCILGSGDLHMAIGLAGIDNYNHGDLQVNSADYLQSIKIWQDRAKREIQGNIGYVNNHMIHYFHGTNKDRGYTSRNKILQKHEYSPYVDVVLDWQRILRFSNNKPQMEEDIRQYFRSRNEDRTSV